MNTTEATKTMNVQEVADHLGVHAQTVRHWIKDGELRAVDVAKSKGGNRSYRITQDDLGAFVDGRRYQPN